tara:strand:- start:4887 stop:5618 length:732 start_codon:yes stop_codon:yes gene_type:complete
MITLSASKISQALGVYGFEGIDACTRDCVRSYYQKESEFSQSIASEYSSSFKEMAIADFSMETSIDVDEADFFKYGDYVGIKPDGICADGSIVYAICRYADRNKSEFESCIEQQKVMIYAHYSMLASNTTKCHVIQWSSLNSRIETIKFSKKFIDRTMPLINDFVENVKEAVDLDSERHLVPIDNSKKAINAKESYLKAHSNLAMAREKLRRAQENISSLCDKDKINIAGLLLTPTDNGVEIS